MNSKELLKLTEWDNPIKHNQKQNTPPPHQPAKEEYTLSWDSLSVADGTYYGITRGEEDVLVFLALPADPKLDEIPVLIRQAKLGNEPAAQVVVKFKTSESHRHLRITTQQVLDDIILDLRNVFAKEGKTIITTDYRACTTRSFAPVAKFRMLCKTKLGLKK